MVGYHYGLQCLVYNMAKSEKALGIVGGSVDEKPIAAKKALLTSRVNTLLSFPMLLTMVAAQNLY